MKGKFKSEIKSLKETNIIIEKEVKGLQNLENEINSKEEATTLVKKMLKIKKVRLKMRLI